MATEIRELSWAAKYIRIGAGLQVFLVIVLFVPPVDSWIVLLFFSIPSLAARHALAMFLFCCMIVGPILGVIAYKLEQKAG